MRRSVPALLAGILILLQAPAIGAEDTKQKAKEHFDKGVDLFKNTDYSGALVEFKAAYKTKPHYAVRYNIGITLYKLKRYGIAHVMLSAYIAEGGDKIPEDKKQEVDEILIKLQSLLGTIKVETNLENAQLFINDEPMSAWIVKLEVGEHTVVVEAPGHDPIKKVVELPGGENVLVEALFEVEVMPPEPVKKEKKKKDKKKKEKEKKKRGKLPPAALWGTLGATVAIGVAAAVTGGAAVKTNKDYEKLTYEDSAWESTQEKGEKLTLATDVLLGITGAAAIATILVAVFTDFGREKKEDVSVIVAPSHTGLTVGLAGAF